ncbi:3-keto-5-aminohexanoate cleavage protein [Actinocrinis puniceicyclus]|uniref:3-keto-5-aminohexanoate cleavage protein n=1 Tax=Actinocrinis puniceicyclus TaxID=977794 RepID=UPI001FEBB76E|nr:3-keto-5-aminohexanoate cleavage protein [Actinocrinis puniceicyclus]
MRIARELGRESATPAEAREIIGLTPISRLATDTARSHRWNPGADYEELARRV